MWEKGQSGNPKGRPKKGNSWSDCLKAIGEQNTVKGKTNKELICEMLYDKAAEGDLTAINAIMDRIEGKPKQVQDIDVTSKGNEINSIAPYTFVTGAQIDRDDEELKG